MSRTTIRMGILDMEGLSLSLSVSRKVTDGQYGSHDVFVSLSGITYDTTPAEMDQLLEVNGALAYSKLKATVGAKIAELKDANKPKP